MILIEDGGLIHAYNEEKNFDDDDYKNYNDDTTDDYFLWWLEDGGLIPAYNEEAVFVEVFSCTESTNGQSS